MKKLVKIMNVMSDLTCQFAHEEYNHHF